MDLSGSPLPIAAIDDDGDERDAIDRQGRLRAWLLTALATAGTVLGGLAIYHSEPHERARALPPSAASHPPSVDDVITRLEANLAANPADPDAWRTLGWAWFQQKRYDDAATALREATDIDPSNAGTWSFLGEALVLASDDDSVISREAQHAFRRALWIDARDPRARFYRGLAAEQDGRHREALELWFELLRDTPADAPYAGNVREAIRTVGSSAGIPVENRIAEVAFAAPLGGMAPGGMRAAAAPAPLATASAAAGPALPGEQPAVTPPPGSPAARANPGPSPASIRVASRLSQAQQDRILRAMTKRLEVNLRRDPESVDGWVRLMRARMELNDAAGATRAYKAAIFIFRNDFDARRKIYEAQAVLAVPWR